MNHAVAQAYTSLRLLLRTCCLLAVLLVTTSLARSQTYTIDWSSIDAGGGASAGGGFSLIGTTGQPNAGTQASGTYSLDGGFWSILRNSDAPLLRITLSGTSLSLFWTDPSTDYVPQQSSSLGTASWTNVSQTVTNIGGQKQIILPLSPGNRFFRLRKP